MNTERISVGAGVFLTGFAAIIDGAQALLALTGIGLGAGPLLDIVALIGLSIGFAHCHVSMMHPKRALRFLMTTVGEALPGIDALPMWSMTVAYTVFQEWRRGGTEAL
jgi:hypothetical protein